MSGSRRHYYTKSEDTMPNQLSHTTIEIEGLIVYAYHGVAEQESKVGNRFEVNLSLRFDGEEAMRTDNLSLTVNYAEVVEAVKEEMATPSKLLEHVAYRISRTLSQRFPQITGGKLSIYKLNPPISAELGKVGFVYCW